MGNEVIFGKITTGWGLVARETDHVITRLEIKSSPTLSTSISEASRLNQTPMVSDWINHLYTKSSVQFSCSVMSDSLQPHGLRHAQASLSITNSQSLLKLLSIESVMPSNHLIFCHPLLLPPSIFPSIRVFSNESYTRKPPFKKKNDGGWESSRLVSMWRCWEGCSLWRTRKVHATSHTPCPCVSFIWLFQSCILLRSTSDLVNKLFSWVLRAALANYWTEERIVGMYRMTWTCYWCWKWEGRTVLRDGALNLWDLMLCPGGCCQNWIKLGFLGGSDSKESAGNAGDPGSVPGSGRSPGEGNGNPVFLPGEFHGQKSLVGYRPWHHKVSDMTEAI